MKHHLMSAESGKGLPRPYVDALRMGVIDVHIRDLVAAFNVDGILASVSSCEGHGRFGRYSSPYVAFRTSSDVAAALHMRLEADAMSARPRLTHYWAIEGRFRENGELIFRLAIPGIGYYWHLSRTSLDEDFGVLDSMLKETLDHIGRQKSGLEGTNKQRDCDKASEKSNHLVSLGGALFSKRIGGVTATATGCSLTKWFAAVYALIQRHLLFSILLKKSGTDPDQCITQRLVVKPDKASLLPADRSMATAGADVVEKCERDFRLSMLEEAGDDLRSNRVKSPCACSYRRDDQYQDHANDSFLSGFALYAEWIIQFTAAATGGGRAEGSPAIHTRAKSHSVVSLVLSGDRAAQNGWPDGLRRVRLCGWFLDGRMGCDRSTASGRPRSLVEVL